MKNETPTFVSLFAATPTDLPNMLAIFCFWISVLFLTGAMVIPETKGHLRWLKGNIIGR